MKVIGLTGGIASGKTTVSKILINELNVPLIDADVLAYEVVQPGKPAYKKIKEFFGKQVINKEGTLNRKLLGDIVFNDKEKLKELNDIVHPEVEKRFNELKINYKNNRKKLIVYDCPLLIEEHLFDNVDDIILVYSDRESQIERLEKRNKFSREEALLRIETQMPMEEKVKYANYVIVNDGNIEELTSSVIALWNNISIDD